MNMSDKRPQYLATDIYWVINEFGKQYPDTLLNVELNVKGNVKVKFHSNPFISRFVKIDDWLSSRDNWTVEPTYDDFMFV